MRVAGKMRKYALYASHVHFGNDILGWLSDQSFGSSSKDHSADGADKESERLIACDNQVSGKPLLHQSDIVDAADGRP